MRRRLSMFLAFWGAMSGLTSANPLIPPEPLLLKPTPLGQPPPLIEVGLLGLPPPPLDLIMPPLPVPDLPELNEDHGHPKLHWRKAAGPYSDDERPGCFDWDVGVRSVSYSFSKPDDKAGRPVLVAAGFVRPRLVNPVTPLATKVDFSKLSFAHVPYGGVPILNSVGDTEEVDFGYRAVAFTRGWNKTVEEGVRVTPAPFFSGDAALHGVPESGGIEIGVAARDRGSFARVSFELGAKKFATRMPITFNYQLLDQNGKAVASGISVAIKPDEGLKLDVELPDQDVTRLTFRLFGVGLYCPKTPAAVKQPVTYIEGETTTPVPVPPAAVMFATGVFGLSALRKWRLRKA